MKEISKIKVVLCFLLFFVSSYSQIETIPAESEIYTFLQKLNVKGVISNYNGLILPKSKDYVREIISGINPADLNGVESVTLDRIRIKYFPDLVDHTVYKQYSQIIPRHVYTFKDQNLSAFFDPHLSASVLSSSEAGGASLFELGGKIYGTYKNVIGFKVFGSNGFVRGNREAAKLNKNVEQSFTFNDTKLNYFDNTEGYIRIGYENVSLQLGRERVLWGNGYNDKLVLSNNPPKFDFIKFDFEYGSFSYNFIHGWLVRKPVYSATDSLIKNIERKPEKYFAISRIGYNSKYVNAGISQLIVYADRSFEAAYLNPFLFWESAQRSMNDVDNSFLSLDGRFRFIQGTEFIVSAVIDDIDFERISKGEWFDNSNGFAWQTGIYLTDPILPENLDFTAEYSQLRPYTFSHPGYFEQLTYTNNGYMLGMPLQPNSIKFSSSLQYRLSSFIRGELNYSQVKHGRNLTDANGNLIKSVGGDVYRFLTIDDDQNSYLLKGELETLYLYGLSIVYEPVLGYYLKLNLEYSDFLLKGERTTNKSVHLTFFREFE